MKTEPIQDTMIYTLPYIQDIAGSIKQCRVATSPAKTSKNMRAMLTIVRDKKEEILELHLVGIRKLNADLIEHEINYTSLGERDNFRVYDSKGNRINGMWVLVGGQIVPNESQIRAHKEQWKYRDRLEKGHLVARKYVNVDIKETFSSTTQPQTICMERWNRDWDVYEKYLECYDEHNKLLCQSHYSAAFDNPLDIKSSEMYVHYYDNNNIGETYVTFHGHPHGWRTALYKYFYNEKGMWTYATVKVVVGTSVTGNLLEEEIERKYAYDLKTEEKLLKEYEILKTFVKQDSLPF